MFLRVLGHTKGPSSVSYVNEYENVLFYCDYYLYGAWHGTVWEITGLWLRSTMHRFVKNCDLGVSPRSSIFSTFRTMTFLDNKKMIELINYNVLNRILYFVSLCWTTYFGGWYACFLCEISGFKMATVVVQVAVLMIVQELRRRLLKCDGTRAETRFRLSPKETLTTGSRGVRVSVSNAVYTTFRGSVKSTGYALHSPVFPSLPLSCVTVCHQVTKAFYDNRTRALFQTFLWFRQVHEY